MSRPRTQEADRRDALGVAHALLVGLALLLILAPGCSCRRVASVSLRPPAGRAPVTPGEIVQLRLALEGLDLLPSTYPPDSLRLAALCSAWATFYHWPDPKPTDRDRYRFVEALCRARLPQRRGALGLAVCVDRLEQSLVHDVRRIVEAYQAAGHPDRIDEYSLSQIRTSLERRERRLQQSQLLRREERRQLELPQVSRCRIGLPRGPLLQASRTRVSLDGFGLASAPRGLSSLSAPQRQTVAQALEARLTELLAIPGQDEPPRTSHRPSPRSHDPRLGHSNEQARRPYDPARRPAIPTKAPLGLQGELLLAMDQRVGQPGLGRLLRLVARLGVGRLCVVVEGHPSFRTPCCLPARLSPRLADDSRYLLLNGASSRLVEAGAQSSLPARPTPASLARARSARTLRLGPQATWRDVAAWLAGLHSRGSAPPELVLDLSHPRREPRRPGR